MCGKPGFAARHAVRWSCYIAIQLTASPGRDLMRELTRSRIQDGGRQMLSVNTVPFLSF